MSFEIELLSPAGSNAGKGKAPQQFSYKNLNDTIEEMVAADYFNAAAYTIGTNDMISVIASDGMAILHVTSSNPTTLTVAIDSNIISNQGGSDSSGAFHNVYTLDDFPVQNETIITLEDGVNYQVYIEGPVTSQKTFDLDPTGYTKGGSLVYMGGEGVLKWNHDSQNNSNWLKSGSQQSAGHFTLKGFDVVDLNGLANRAVDIEGSSTAIAHLWSHVIIQDCEFTDFIGVMFLKNIRRLTLENVDNFQPTVDSTKVIVEIDNLDDGHLHRLNLFQSSGGHVALKITPTFTVPSIIEKARIYVSDSEFVLQESNISAVDLPSTVNYQGVVDFSNCVARDIKNAAAAGFDTRDMGNIEKIEEGNTSSHIKITTMLPHGLAGGELFLIHETLNYNGISKEVEFTPAPTSLTFEVGQNYTVDNYGGIFGRGSFNPYLSNNIHVNGGVGFEAPVTTGACTVSFSFTNQSIGALNTFQVLSFSAGEILPPVSGLNKDFRMSSFTSIELENTGKTVINALVTLDLYLQNGTSADFFFIFRNGGTSVDTRPFRIRRDTTPSEVASISSVVRLSPGDTIFPMIEQRLGTLQTDINIKDITFTVFKI